MSGHSVFREGKREPFTFFAAVNGFLAADAGGHPRDTEALSILPFRLSRFDAMWEKQENYEIHSLSADFDLEIIRFEVRTRASGQSRRFFVEERTDDVKLA